jgi:hypothetical protein
VRPTASMAVFFVPVRPLTGGRTRPSDVTGPRWSREGAGAALHCRSSKKRTSRRGVAVTMVTPAEAVSLACCSRGRYGKHDWPFPCSCPSGQVRSLLMTRACPHHFFSAVEHRRIRLRPVSGRAGLARGLARLFSTRKWGQGNSASALGSGLRVCAIPERPASVIRWMTPPSVRMPRSANETKRAKQLSGIASASNRSRFIADISGFAAAPAKL